jgi:hypothetical protein
VSPIPKKANRLTNNAKQRPISRRWSESLDFNLAGILGYARTDCDIMTLFDGINKLWYFAQGRGSIGIHEEHVTTFRVEHAKPYCSAFSHMRTPESPNPDVSLLKQTAKRKGLIFAAIIADNHFEIESVWGAPADSRACSLYAGMMIDNAMSLGGGGFSPSDEEISPRAERVSSTIVETEMILGEPLHRMTSCCARSSFGQ